MDGYPKRLGIGFVKTSMVNKFALRRLDRACAERLAGFADIEFYHIGRQV